MKKQVSLLIGMPLLALSVAFSPSVHAESGSGSESSSTTRMHQTETENETEHQTESEHMSSTEMHTSSEREKRRTELELKVSEVKTENKVHLDEARKKVCETRTGKINSILQKRSEQASKHLAVFKKISERVQTFATSKNLTVENYDTLVAAIAEKEAAVQAAIDVNSATAFDCATAPSDNPNQVPKTTVEAVRTALKEYRTAIKNLIVNVKASAEKAEAVRAPNTTSGEVSQ